MSESEVALARELGGINEKLKRIEDILDDMHHFDARIAMLEKTVLEFKTQVALVAFLVSAGTGAVSIVFNAWGKLKEIF